MGIGIERDITDAGAAGGGPPGGVPNAGIAGAACWGIGAAPPREGASIETVPPTGGAP
jgi:hypothetical protein